MVTVVSFKTLVTDRQGKSGKGQMHVYRIHYFHAGTFVKENHECYG